MLLTIDQGDDEPLYRQLAASVRRAIATGDLAPGDPLPATRDAASALGVNPETVQRAYRLLAEEDVVVSRVGRGTRIHDAVDAQGMALDDAINDLVVRARRVGLSRTELAERIRHA